MVKPTLEPGSTIDGFRIEELVHQGGMATLWRVSRDDVTTPQLTPMLMKVPIIGEGADPAAIVSFEMEQMIMPRLEGVHVPKFIAAGDFAVQPYIVMERIAGTTLLPRLAELPLPYAEVAEIGAKVATALCALHRQHVVHLDVKPSNIMVRPTGEAVLIDFGLSHHHQMPDLMQAEFRVPFGTAPYMSPEQLLGQAVDTRSDLFSAGVVLYQFLTGEKPFTGERATTVITKVLSENPAPPSSLDMTLPASFDAPTRKALAKKPDERFQSGREFAEALRAAYESREATDKEIKAAEAKSTQS